MNVVHIVGSLFVLLVAVSDLSGQTTPDSTAPKVQPAASATIESLFDDFLHYARMGKFQLADSYAKSLFAHPELDPIAVVHAADKDPESLKVLRILIERSSIPESAARVLDLIQQGQDAERKQPTRILQNIKLLGGDPQQEAFARRQLAESGEYAIPYMIAALNDRSQSRLWPRIIFALPAIGKAAVNPLVIALSMSSNDIRLHVIEALGSIGYPQAIPYLRKLLADDSMPAETKTAAQSAIDRIEKFMSRSYPGSAANRFFSLAELYFDEDDTVGADPRLSNSNVWYWDAQSQSLTRKVVPQSIFGAVMAMRCCQEALRLKNDHVDALALWLAANIRRESRLGLNTESGDPNETGDVDSTRPDVFPRALYFTQTAGPRYAHLVLDRAVEDQDSAVALGAIEALRMTAGEASLVGTEDFKQPLVQALQFPDLVVRLRAALALGAALPRSQFAGSQHVVPLLAAALTQTGREQVLVVDPDEAELNRVAGLLREGNREVIAETDFLRGLDRARTEFQNISGVFLAAEPGGITLGGALQSLHDEFILAKTPVVVLADAQSEGLAEEYATTDRYVEVASAGAEATDLEAAFARVRERTKEAPFDEKLARSIALQAGQTLKRIASDGRTIFDVVEAEPALIATLSADGEDLQTLAASVLALLPTSTAQRAIAQVALDDATSKSLRLATFGSLAQSARTYGLNLEDDQVATLVKIAQQDDDLVIRTAASQALGAANLEANQASEIVRSYFGG